MQRKNAVFIWLVAFRKRLFYTINERKIPGSERVGRIRLILENAEKSTDTRVKSGKYKNWRKKYRKNKAE